MSAPQVLFLSHGGGPMPLLGDPSHQEMVKTLQALSQLIRRPKAIIVISAHWEASPISITHAARPALIYDYYGFPPESYQLQYPAAGQPLLAETLLKAMQTAGLSAKLDEQRGFDHGLFVPLKILYPDADIPCVQVSLQQDLDPETHIQLGQALANAVDADTLIIGSGFSFHNMRAFFATETQDSQNMNTAFEDWLIETCTDTMPEQQRRQRLQHWAQTPYARYCHPREEHLLPLHVCYGARQRACDTFVELTILNKKASMYLWQ